MNPGNLPSDTPPERPGAVSDRRIMATARALRRTSHALEWLVFLLIAASVVLIASVASWVYVPLWWSSFVILGLTGWRALLASRLRAQLGPQRFEFHPSNRWLILDDTSPYGIPGWSFDLARPLFPRTALLIPGVLLIGWVIVQLLALPPGLTTLLNVTQPLGGGEAGASWQPISVSVQDTRRGLAFLLTMAAFHVSAAAAYDQRPARARFLGRLRFLGLALSLGGLAQLASGTHKLWGLVPLRHGDGNYLTFGPFVNRDHYAAYMLMLTPLAFGALTSHLRDLARSVGRGANLRRLAVGVLQRSGAGLAYAGLPALAMLASLVATTSRGALLAFAGALLLASLRLIRRSHVSSWGAVIVVAGLALSWFGLDRLTERFGRAETEAPGRTIVWRDSLQRMEGRWVTGFGLDTFGAAISRTTAWALPIGATPWRDPFETSIAGVARAGYRAILPEPGLNFYTEAVSDYLQLLTEVGVVGLGLALWGIARLVKRDWRDPWLLAAVVAPLLHEAIDFGFQVPAVSVLFAVVSALRPSRG